MAHEKFGSDAHHHKDKRLARCYLCRDLRSDVHAYTLTYRATRVCDSTA